jgi:acylphosphatase
MDASKASRQLGSPALGQLFDDLLPMGRRARNRESSYNKRFVTRQQPQRPAPFMERWRMIVEGRVQGVGFRTSCHRRALELGLRGWVRNRPDGSVEVQAEGRPLDIAELRAWCEKGSAQSQVTRVKPSQLPITGDDWFEVRS